LTLIEDPRALISVPELFRFINGTKRCTKIEQQRVPKVVLPIILEGNSTQTIKKMANVRVLLFVLILLCKVHIIK
jgi:hypothetical protein